MTKEQQKIVDGLHERVITLIFKRRRAVKYGCNSQKDWDDITKEIDKIEDERRTYERNCRAPGEKESKIKGSVPETAAGTECNKAETDF